MENTIPKTNRKFKATTDSKHNLTVAPNLLQRQFYVGEANRVWVGDIIVIPDKNCTFIARDFWNYNNKYDGRIFIYFN